MRKICLALGILLLMTGCVRPRLAMRPFTAAAVPETKEAVERKLDPLETTLKDMTTAQKVGQLFLVAAPNDDALSVVKKFQFGGVVLFGDDVDGKTPETLKQMIDDFQSACKIPMLIATDEEGGSVCRISCNIAFRNTRFLSPKKLLQEGGPDLLIQTEEEKCQLLHSVGINVNLSPVCDITTEPGAFMYSRSLGEDPQECSNYVQLLVDVMNTNHIGSVLKHFPGYGNNTDTHVAMAIDKRPLSQLESVDLMPFQAGMNAGCDAVMVSHTIVAAIDSQNPATLSPAVHDYLRKEMAYERVIVTDDLNMDAITEHYGPGEAAVLAILAGNDLLCTWSYETQFDAVLEAVNSGRISIEQLDQSVLRILQWKHNLGLIP